MFRFFGGVNIRRQLVQPWKDLWVGKSTGYCAHKANWTVAERSEHVNISVKVNDTKRI